MDNVYDYVETSQFQNAPESSKEARENESRGATNAVKIAHFLFIGALFLLPFIFVPIPGWSVVLGKVIVTTLLALSAGIVIFSSVFSGKQIVVPRTYTTILLGMLVMVVFSTVFSESVSASLFGTGLETGTAFTTIIAIMLGLVAPLILSSRKRLVSAVGSLFAGAVVLGLFHLIRLIVGPDFLSFGFFTIPASTPAGSWNDLGIFFGVIYLISLVSLAFGSLPQRVRTILTLSLIVSLFFVFVVNFKLLSILLTLVTLGILIVAFLSRKQNVIVPATISFVILLFLGIFAGPVGGLVGRMFNTSYAEIRPNWASTTDMVGAGLSDIKNAVLGSGPNTFTYLWQQKRAQDVINSNFWSVDFTFASGIVPTFIITLGLISALLMLLFAGYLARVVYRAAQEREADPLLSALTLATGFAAVFLWLLAILYVFSAMIFLLMFVLSGISIAAFTQMGGVKTMTLESSTRLGSLVGAVGAVICFLLIVPALLLSVSRTIYGQGVMEANLAKNIDEVANAQQKVRQASILERNDAFARTETQLGILRIQEFLTREDTDESDVEPFKNLAAQTQDAATRATMINPRNYFNWVNIGIVYETLGLLKAENGFDLAAQSYAQARALNPTNPELILIQARLERARKNDEQARTYAKEAIALKENYSDAYLLLADIDLVNKNPSGAISEIQTALEKLPNNTFLLYQLGLVYYSEKNYNKAKETFTKAIVIDPNYANARYFRALSYIYGENDTKQALQDLEFISKQNADNKVLQEVIANIKSGKDPLDGIAEDEPVLPPVEDGEAPTDSNANAIESLESQSKPKNQADGTEAPKGSAPEAGSEPSPEGQ